MTIKVSIVEDDNELRESLAVLVNGTPGLRCLSRFATGEAALRPLSIDPPEVLLVDIKLPRMSGIDLVTRLKPQLPHTQFLMLTVIDDANQIFDALKAGASGYLLKGTPPAEILAAIADVHRGGSPMTSSIARKVVRYFHRLQPSVPVDAVLSPRESEILACLAQGRRYKEIAADLSISEFTVRNHLRHIYEKLQVHSRTEAVVKYLQK